MAPPEESEVISYFDRLSNWGRWGKEDELGTLNFITPQKRLAALSYVKEGKVISCSRTHQIGATVKNPDPLMHFMLRSPDTAPEHGKGGAADWVGLNIHGYNTHFDTLSHYCWNRQIYNGRSASVVSTEKGATEANVEVIKEGVFSKAVVLDLPRMFGVDALEGGYLVSREDLERCEKEQGVSVESGDVLMYRTGTDNIERSPGGPRPGLGADCLPFLYEREVAVLVGDSGHDVRPQQYKTIENPIHTVALVAMGMQFIDSAYMEELVTYCAAQNRWSFLFAASPLRLERTTGSPCNPLAIF